MSCNAGLLTRAQLRAALHSLGLLASKPPAFSSSVRRTAAAAPSTPSAHHSQREGSVVDSLWQLLAGSQSECKSATHGTKVSPSPSSGKAPGLKYLQPDEAAANQADSCDTLLCESMELWHQLIGQEPRSIEAARAVNTQTPTNPSAISAAKPGQDFPLSVETAKSLCSTSDQPAQQKVRAKKGTKSAMHGVSLQQLLAFVLHVQQHSSRGQSAASLQAALTDRQNTELNKIARMCSHNKLANMTYVGIGNSRVQRLSPLQLKAAPGRAVGRCTGHAEAHSQHPDLTNKLRPRGEHFPSVKPGLDLRWHMLLYFSDAADTVSCQNMFTGCATTVRVTCKSRPPCGLCCLVDCKKSGSDCLPNLLPVF